MRIATLCLTALPGLLPGPLAAQDRSRNPQLEVAFVGDVESERGKAFQAFLTQQFGGVKMVARTGCDPAQLRGLDVVLLDWGRAAAIVKGVREGLRAR